MKKRAQLFLPLRGMLLLLWLLWLLLLFPLPLRGVLGNWLFPFLAQRCVTEGKKFCNLYSLGSKRIKTLL